MPRRLSVTVERFQLATAFTISRGSKTEAVVVVATLFDGDKRGRGECVPYARYGENVESVSAAIETARAAIEAGVSRDDLQRWLVHVREGEGCADIMGETRAFLQVITVSNRRSTLGHTHGSRRFIHPLKNVSQTEHAGGKR